jgi:hypothetical protein
MSRHHLRSPLAAEDPFIEGPPSPSGNYLANCERVKKSFEDTQPDPRLQIGHIKSASRFNVVQVRERIADTFPEPDVAWIARQYLGNLLSILPSNT